MDEIDKDGLGDAYRLTVDRLLEALGSHADGLSQSEASDESSFTALIN